MTNTIELTTAQALVKFLAAQYTERDGERRRLIAGVLGIFGHGNAAGLGQALSEPGTNMPVIQGKHEQSMVHTALGFAKENDRLSTMAVTTSIGPGAANLVTGAGTATINRLPVLLLPGDVFATRRQGPVLQQIEQISAMDVTTSDSLRAVSRYFDRITRPSQLIESLPRAVSALLEQGDAGAVTLSLCQDVQGELAEWPVELFEERVHIVHRQPAAPTAIEEAVAAIKAAKRPIIVAGGGVRYSRAGAALAALASTAKVPVVETYAGRGSARECEVVGGGIGIIGSGVANDIAGQADLVIAVGTRLTDVVTGSRTVFAPGVKFVSVNLSAIDLAKNFAIAVRGDARATLEAIHDGLNAAGISRDDAWQRSAADQIAAWRERANEVLAVPQAQMHGYEVVNAVNEFTDAADRVIVASSTAIGHAHAHWTSEAELDLEYGYSCMGYEIPAALGHRLARSEGDTYTILGDGTYLMGYTGEFVTAIQEGLRFTSIVLVNGGWQCINRFEQGAIGRTWGTQFKSKTSSGEYDGETIQVDYAANAASFGCEVADVHSLRELSEALERSRSGNRPLLIAAHVVDDDPDFSTGSWWDFGSAEGGASPDVAKRHEEHVAAGARQGWYL